MPGGKIIALDILDMTPLSGVDFILGDFHEADVLATLEAMLAGRKVDVVMSDMAPNMTGQKSVDRPRALYLVELALDFAEAQLTPKGVFISKLFHGEGFDALIKMLRTKFKKVVIFKPEASRGRSPEVYVVAIEKK